MSDSEGDMLEIDADARIWLDEIEDRMYTVIAGSNFYNSFAQECEDLVVFGTGPSITYEDERDLIRVYNPTVGEYYLSSDATGRIGCQCKRRIAASGSSAVRDNREFRRSLRPALPDRGSCRGSRFRQTERRRGWRPARRAG